MAKSDLGAFNLPTPGSADFYKLPIAERSKLYNEARYSSRGADIPSSLYYTQNEISYFQKASMPAAQWASEIRKLYPGYAAYLNVPEIGGILHMSTVQHWNPGITKEAVESSNWWKTHSDTQRQWYLTIATDPGAAAQALTNQMQIVSRTAAAYGIHVNPTYLTAIATNALSSGWDQERIIQELVNTQQATGQKMTGQLGATQDDLRKLASDYMIPMGDRTLQNWTRNVATGKATTDGFTDYVRNLAKSRFTDPQIQHALDAGQSMRDFAEPYVQMAATTLNLAPDQIDLTQGKWRKPLEYRPDAKQPARAMTLDEWGQELRTNGSYGYDFTDAARGQAAQFATTLLQKFGNA